MDKLPEEKKGTVDQFLQGALIARMATANVHGIPHVVPVWYGWDGKTLWISSFKNTRKVGELEKNPAISVSIDIADENGQTKAVIMEGTASLIKEPRELVHRQSQWIYTRYLGEEGVKDAEPQSWIVDPLNLLICLTPSQLFLRGF
jgi:nitroimidazol reductase NimA-like FMN-containing flavoprotein (pyridoxamine 5'-phosphate oxidase superfamily)